MQFIKDNVTIDPETNCWNWNKSTTSAGYGQFTRNKKYWTTHRFVATYKFGDIPKDQLVRHLCNNTKCCNPDHLTLGTDKDNWKDSEEVHRLADSKRAKGCLINGVYYRTIRLARDKTGITMKSLIKYTDKATRVFNIEAYHEGCEASRRWKPKI